MVLGFVTYLSYTLILCHIRLHSQETHNVIRKLTLDYVNFTRECWIHTSVSICMLSHHEVLIGR